MKKRETFESIVKSIKDMKPSEIAKKLGVKLNERFYLRSDADDSNIEFKIVKEGVICKPENQNDWYYNEFADFLVSTALNDKNFLKVVKCDGEHN